MFAKPFPGRLTSAFLLAVLPSVACAGISSDAPAVSMVSTSKVFEEPLVPIGRANDEQAQKLALVLGNYVSSGSLDNLGSFDRYLEANPDSPWRLSLLVNLGLMRRHVGQMSAALKAWEAAWEGGQSLVEPVAVALTNRALGELLEAYAGLGAQERLEALVQASASRPLLGLVTEKVSAAKESLTYMRMSPATAFRCGPMALAFLKATVDPLAFADPAIRGFLSTPKGTTLTMNATWSKQVGLSLQMAKRLPGSPLPAPCIVHFRQGHFAALVYAKDGRYLVQDPFLGDSWMSLATLDQETTGYALVPAGPLPSGWAPVTEEEGSGVWGRGAWGPGRPDGTRPDSFKFQSTLNRPAACWVKPAYHADLGSLNLEVPLLTYTPAYGPRVDFTVTYNQREFGQPQVFDYCNLGPKWTFSFLACLKDDTTNPDADVTLCNPGGGGQTFHTCGDGSFLPENGTQARLLRIGGGGYRIEYPSGRKECYDLADRAWGLRRVVLTHVQDAFGNEVDLTWDASLRLVAIKDAAGLTSHIQYEAADPLHITSVTDPFGKVARIQYDNLGRLVQLTDCGGRNAAFVYGPPSGSQGVPLDFIQAMTTGSSTLTFRSGETLVGPSYRRWVEGSGPSGESERLESAAGYAYEIPPEKLPETPELDVGYHPLAFRFRESFFWRAGQLGPNKPDYRKAEHIRWGHGPGGFSSGIVLSQKAPDQPRHWFVHTGDFWDGVFHAARTPAFPLTPEGTLRTGNTLVRVVGSVANQNSLAPVFDGNRDLVTRDYWNQPGQGLVAHVRDYDLTGRLVREMGPAGTHECHWDPATGDLRRYASPGKGQEHRFLYDAFHKLLQWQRPGGSTLTFDYNPKGRLTGCRGVKGAPWTFAYDDRGRLSQAHRRGLTWEFTWNERNELKTVRKPQGKLVELATEGASPSSPAGPSALGLGRPMAIPVGCERAFASILDGANGSVLIRLLALS